MKRLAVFSDIHGNYQALKSIIDDIEKEEIEREDTYFLGDMIGFGPNPKECVDLIMNSKIKAVKGNHEIYQTNDEISRMLLTNDEKDHRLWVRSELNKEELDYIRKLPMSIEEMIFGNLYNFSHFFLNKNKNYFESLKILNDSELFEVANKIETDYMFIGHCHDDFQVHSERLVTCGGSSGCTINESTFYLIVEIDGSNVKIIRKELVYDRKAFEKEISKKDYPGKEKYAFTFFGIK